jgi:hypothetical protein
MINLRKFLDILDRDWRRIEALGDFSPILHDLRPLGTRLVYTPSERHATRTTVGVKRSVEFAFSRAATARTHLFGFKPGVDFAVFDILFGLVCPAIESEGPSDPVNVMFSSLAAFHTFGGTSMEDGQWILPGVECDVHGGC